MANQKVKHIIAKLVGQSTESTLDVYDVDAVHTDKIANNLTTTSSGYVLDARQGKALNDSLAALFKMGNYTYSGNISANGSVFLTPTDIGLTVPSGYAVVAIRGVSTGNSSLVVTALRPHIEDTATNIIGIRNLSNSSQTCNLSLGITFMKIAFYGGGVTS